MKAAISMKFLLAILLIIPAITQYMSYINCDDAWLLHAATRVFAGQALYKDVVETNPPLAVYVNFIPIYFAKISGLGTILSFKIFVFTLGAASVFFCYHIKRDNVLLSVALFSLLVYVGLNFGQREHFFNILFLPYLFCLTNKTGSGNRFLAALMAGIAVSLKPYFVVIWLAVLIANAYAKRDFKSIFVLDNWIIGLVGASYLAYLVFIEKTYIAEILPLLLKYYDAGFNPPLKGVLIQVLLSSVICFMGPLVVYIKFPQIITREIIIFIGGSIGAIGSLLLQQKAFTNHFLPIGFFGLWLNFYLLKELISLKNQLWKDCAMAICGIVLLQFFATAVAWNFQIVTKHETKNLEETISLINKYASNQNVYYITPDLPDAFPAVLYSSATYSGKYGHLWFVIGLYKNAPQAKNGELIYHPISEQNTDEQEIIRTVVNEITFLKPKIIIVTNKKEYASHSMGEYKFDYLKYFLTNPEFKRKWQEYKKVKDIDGIAIYVRIY
jgi:hypothetical protein